MNKPPIYIPRPQLLERIHKNFWNNRTVVLQGPRGSGKTTLAKAYSEEYKNYFSDIKMFSHYEVPRVIELRKAGWNDSEKKELIIIDDFDQFFLDRDRHYLLDSINSYRHSGMHLLITTSTENHLEYIRQFEKVQIEKFSPQEIKTIIAEVTAQLALAPNEGYTLMEMIQKSGGLPADIMNILNFFGYYKQTGISLETTLISPLTYDNNIIEQPGLITDTRVINEFLWDSIKKNPDMLYNVHPRKFEEIVADMYTKLGYSVQLTPCTNDGGKDIYVVEKNHLGKFLYLVECKRNAAHNRVGVGVISNLYGRVNHEKATAGVVITTSYFTKPAIKFKENIHHQLNLIDYSNLCEMISKLKL